MANEELAAQIAAQIAAMGPLGGVLLLLFLAVLLAPVFLVMFSKRVHGGKKLFWVALMGTFSWLAYPAYRSALRKADKATDGSSEMPGA